MARTVGSPRSLAQAAPRPAPWPRMIHARSVDGLLRSRMVTEPFPREGECSPVLRDLIEEAGPVCRIRDPLRDREQPIAGRGDRLVRSIALPGGRQGLGSAMLRT